MLEPPTVIEGKQQRKMSILFLNISCWEYYFLSRPSDTSRYYVISTQRTSPWYEKMLLHSRVQSGIAQFVLSVISRQRNQRPARSAAALGARS